MPNPYASELYQRLRREVDAVSIVDCHEHLQRDADLPTGDAIHLGRFFLHYASCDLIAAGMPREDMAKVKDDPMLSPRDRWQRLDPWYRKAWNTAYCESLRIAARDLYGIEELSEGSADALTEAMRRSVKPGFTRQVFDRANIDFAMNNIWQHACFSAAQDPLCFLPDMLDGFTGCDPAALAQQTGRDIHCLDDYCAAIESCFARYASLAGAFKVGRAYDRTLSWEDVPRSAAETVFNRLLAFNDRPGRRDLQLLEDYLLHHLCRLCGDHGLRMKFHTGLQEGNGNLITHSRAALMANLFLKYPKTGFDIYHISYPYQEELVTLAKNFANVSVDFCWMWIINPAAGRRALSDMLDAVPASKIHGFGGDYLFVEGTYGHAAIARREITRVLCEKVEEGRFSEDYAVEVAHMLLRDNALANFGLARRRRAFARSANLA
ncbi:MAG: glucuronate isomerase [Lentisphaerae bacterium ADurb.BinA184]|nr:MAG: glucuronate isomerase [Lentisphaerae bacterium ADurb.BinA184]